MNARRLVTLVVLAAAGCTVEQSAAEYGEALFADPAVAGSSRNTFACATCHQTGATDDLSRIDSGANLRGVAARASFWGGQELRLLDAVNACLIFFMRAPRPLDEDDLDGHALAAYLESITPSGSPTDTLPFTVQENVLDFPVGGDAARGAVAYDAACGNCHGALHTGSGGLLGATSRTILPELTDEYATLFPGFDPRLVVTEKVRHGRFFDIGGAMPLYSLEALDDATLADILAHVLP